MPPTDPPPEWVLQRRQAIGDRIRRIRMRANLTQEKLAEQAGLDRQAINRLEQGHSSPRLDTLIRIAQALDVPVWRLFRDDDQPSGEGSGC